MVNVPARHRLYFCTNVLKIELKLTSLSKMTRTNLFAFTLLAISTLSMISCGGDPCDDLNIPPGFTCNEDQGVFCGTTCDAGEVLLATCTCGVDPSTITPDPCENAPACSGGQVLVWNPTPGQCMCMDLMDDDPCAVVTCPAGFLCDDGTCVPDPSQTQEIDVSGEITADVTWSAPNIYTLQNRVTVTTGTTLTIEPGVVVKGQAGTGANASALLIARGATINAMGTPAQPIIFTSVADEITSGQLVSPNLDSDVNGLWGGIIVLGNAPISAANDAGDIAEVQIEGIATSDPNGLYGGNDANDNSGVLNYISIRHGGTNIGEGNEINGLTLGGVGAGTLIQGVEVVANQDDGIEWFGGTVSASEVLVWNCGDDGLDTDQAWNGTCTDWVVALPAGGSAMELDGPEGSLTQGPNNFVNGTIFCGPAANIDHIIDWDGSTNTGISNLYIFGIDEAYDPSSGIESFGGDGTGMTGSWQFTVPAGYDVATLFVDVPTREVSEVAMNANTVGSTANLSWTLGGQSGVLASIGL